MAGRRKYTKTKVAFVEGDDEVYLFNALLTHMGLADDIEILKVGGKTLFPGEIKNWRSPTGSDKVISIGVVQDADNDPTAAFATLCQSLSDANLPMPTVPLQPQAGPPQVTVMIVPDLDTKGMIEDVCLASVGDDPALICVDRFFECLKSQRPALAENKVPKARVRAFLAHKELLEIAHFEYLQKCVRNYQPVEPVSPAIVVPKVDAFLASRYTPNLRLGEAAGKSGDDRYWQFDHPAFDKLKQFFRML